MCHKMVLNHSLPYRSGGSYALSSIWFFSRSYIKCVSLINWPFAQPAYIFIWLLIYMLTISIVFSPNGHFLIDPSSPNSLSSSKWLTQADGEGSLHSIHILLYYFHRLSFHPLFSLLVRCASLRLQCFH